MATPLDTARRLLGALEELVRQETLLIRVMDFSEALAVQQRAAPLVEQLCLLAENASVQALRSQVTALIERRSQNSAFLATELQRVQGELHRLTAVRGQVRNLAPAYRGVPVGAESRLNAAA